MSTLLALIIAAAGWYYLFYSKAAHHLGTIEATAANIKRVRLRRTNGAAMILLAVLLYLGARAIDPQQSPRVFMYVWLGVIALLLLIVTLAMVDLRLTNDLRRKAKK